MRERVSGPRNIIVYNERGRKTFIFSMWKKEGSGSFCSQKGKEELVTTKRGGKISAKGEGKREWSKVSN